MRKIGGAAEVRTRALDALKLVRLDGLQDRRPSQLSGGQQQRVALGARHRLQARHPAFDEPLGVLDRKLREELQVELKQLQRSLGVTTLLVTHDQEEALSLSDRIMVLDKGRTQQVAAPAEAYLRPANRFVAEFLGIANFVGMADGRTGLVRPGAGAGGAGGHQWRPAGAGRGDDLSRPDGSLSPVVAGEAAPVVAALPFVGKALPRATRSRCRGMRSIFGRWRDGKDNRGGGNEKAYLQAAAASLPSFSILSASGRSRRRSA